LQQNRHNKPLEPEKSSFLSHRKSHRKELKTGPDEDALPAAGTLVAVAFPLGRFSNRDILEFQA
jgi:hypothetical protein